MSATVSKFRGDLKKFGAIMGIKANVVVKKIAIEIHDDLILATPVDTGRARSNWNIALGWNPDETVNDKADWEASKGGARRGTSEARRKQAILSGLADWQQVTITNSVPYIKNLNDGSSTQAPALFIEQAIARVGAKVGEISNNERPE